VIKPPEQGIGRPSEISKSQNQGGFNAFVHIDSIAKHLWKRTFVSVLVFKKNKSHEDMSVHILL